VELKLAEVLEAVDDGESSVDGASLDLGDGGTVRGGNADDDDADVDGEDEEDADDFDLLPITGGAAVPAQVNMVSEYGKRSTEACMI
jgi:hypothetical protein